jgi:Tol biopolymer transport system component
MNADGTGSLRLTSNTVPESGGEISPDGSQVLFLADSNDRFEFYYNRNLFVVPVSGGASRVLDVTHEVNDAHWSDDGKSIYFIANTGVRAELFRMDLASGKTEPLTKGDHTVASGGMNRLSPRTSSRSTSPGTREIYGWSGRATPRRGASRLSTTI